MTHERSRRKRGGRSFADWLWPRQHKRYWDSSYGSREGLRKALDDEPDTVRLLANAKQLPETAEKRKNDAQGRVSLIAAGVSVAAALTTGGGVALLLNGDEIPERGWRIAFAALLFLAVAAFALSALYAVRAAVGFRRWSWELPAPLGDADPERSDEAPGQEDARRRDEAAALRWNFAHNWEVADVKMRAGDSAFRAFLAALSMLILLALTVLAYQIFQ